MAVVLLLLVLVGGWGGSFLIRERGDEQRTEGVQEAPSRMLKALEAPVQAAVADEQRDVPRDNDPGFVTIEDPMYRYALTYHRLAWEEITEAEDLYDQVFLFNGTSLVGLFTDPDYGEDQMDYCVADYVAALKETGDASEVTAVQGWKAVGTRDGRAWATFAYAVTNGGGTESHLVRSFECRPIGDGITLVITHDMPAEDVSEETAARLALLAGLDLPHPR